ncbi:hypothetical protein C8R44DRAFT_870398 [Mycena epipterygia]|nr:hypothetical protein C8R44DRAFT_870398 [Mycena epipterygia]
MRSTTEYLTSITSPDLPLLPFPSLHLYVQTNPHDPSTRTNLDTDPQYDGIRDLTRTLLSHIVGSKTVWIILDSVFWPMSQMDPVAKEALRTKLGSDRELQRTDIIDFLLHDTPAIIFKEFPDNEETIIWGEVLKGEEVGAERNEMFLSMELLRALRDPPPQGLSPEIIEVQRARQSLLWTATYLHECVHCIVKFVFGHHYITPRHRPFARYPGGIDRELGLTFTDTYFGFTLETLWGTEAAKQEGRLWYIEELVAGFDVSPATRILSPDSITKVLVSFQKENPWRLEGGELAPMPSTVNNNSHTRYQGTGNSVAVPAEEGSEDVDAWFASQGLVLLHKAVQTSLVGS